jgi:hypothetical protein
MKPPSRVSSRTKLAEALQISRPTLYAFARLPDSPPARNGYWHVAEWRRFVTRKKGSVKASEKEQLQIAVLRAKLEREQFDLDTARERTRNEIRDDLMQGFVSVAQLIRGGLYRMRTELSPVFASGVDARGVYRAWENKERELWAVVCAELTKKSGARIDEPDTRAENVVVPIVGKRNGRGSTLKVDEGISHRRAATR